MKCVVHPDADAVGYCRNCGKAMCSVCVRPVRDMLYCEDCLANVMGIPGGAPGTAAGVSGSGTVPVNPEVMNAGAPASSGLGPSPMLAFLLGFLPGLRAFCHEQFGSGIIHLPLFLLLCILGLA